MVSIMRMDYFPLPNLINIDLGKAPEVGYTLADSMTKAASKQTYYTIRFLADRDRTHDAYRAYAYFRWVDDTLDRNESPRTERLAFLERQQNLINRSYRGKPMFNLLPQEESLVSLIHSDHEENSGLRTYIRHMMAVMEFDAHRRGRWISQKELDNYSLHLATGVTEALHYFIGHNAYAPRSRARYLAVTAAHITHMLRDTHEDLAAGYFNIPCEYLEWYRLDPCDTESMAFRLWVHDRVQLARTYFAAGKDYLAQVKNWRCRLAGYAYIKRFESVLDTIEKDEYRLRPVYAEQNTSSGVLITAWSALWLILAPPVRGQT